jgi:hypothetical protein
MWSVWGDAKDWCPSSLMVIWREHWPSLLSIWGCLSSIVKVSSVMPTCYDHSDALMVTTHGHYSWPSKPTDHSPATKHVHPVIIVCTAKCPSHYSNWTSSDYFLVLQRCARLWVMSYPILSMLKLHSGNCVNTDKHLPVMYLFIYLFISIYLTWIAP